MPQLTPTGLARLQAQMGNLEACIRCGLCLSVCPTYGETLQEEESPRGRIAQLKAVTEGALPLTPDIVRHEESCLICEACTAVCPSGFRMEPLQLAFQACLKDAQPTRRFLLTQALAPLKGHRTLRALTGLAGAARRAKAAAVLKIVGLGQTARLLPSIADRPFDPRGQRWPAQTPAPARPELVEGSACLQSPLRPSEGESDGSQAVLFAGCVMNTFFPRVHEGTVEVLTARGFSVTAPRAQGCCGILHAHTGLENEAKQLARRNIDGLEDVRGTIVADSAGCAAFLKHYGDLLREDPAYANRARAFSARVREATDLAASRPAPPMGSLNITVTYQDPCHLAHAQGIRQQPRQLLRQIPGLKLIEMAEADVCCGSAGVYNILHPDMGSRLGQRKAARVKETGAAVVCTANPGCHLQLQAYLADSGVRVVHVMEVLAEAQRTARPTDESARDR